MATDTYRWDSEGSQSPARGGFEVTPANTDFTEIAKALYIGGAGNVVVRTADGTDLTFDSVPGGAILPVQCLQVRSSTTATNIVALT